MKRNILIIFGFVMVFALISCGSKPTGIAVIPDMPTIAAKDVSSGTIQLTPEEIAKELDALQNVNQSTVLKKYKLRFNDEFTIHVLGQEDWTSRVKVIPEEGTIMFGYVTQSYPAFGKTFDELKKMILEGFTENGVTVDGLVKYFSDPQLKIDEIKLSETANTLNVLGYFRFPGKVNFQVGYRIMDIYTVVGGLNSRDFRVPSNVPTVDWNKAYIARDNKILHAVNLRELIVNNNFKYNIPVLPGDIINIPEASFDTNKVIVLGEVKNPGVFNFSSKMTLVESIARAGGLNEDRAEPEWVYILRNTTPSEDKNIKLEIYIADLRSLLTKGVGANAILQADDIVYVSTSAWAKFCVDIGRFAPFWTNVTAPANLGYNVKFIAS